MIQALFEKVRRKQQQRAGDAFSQYWEGVVQPLAQGREVDPEAIVQAAEAIGRDASAVEADVALYRRRQQLSEELAAVPRWQAESARLQVQIDRLNAELSEAQSKLGSKIQEAYAAKLAIESRIDNTTQHQRDLVQSCPNPELTQREQELQVQRKELLEKRQPVAESLGAGQGTLGGGLSHAQRQLGEFEERAAAGDTDAREYVQRLRGTIAGYEERISDSQSRLSGIDEQLSEIDRELAVIRAKKLIP